MLENLLFSVNAVLPIFLLVGLGWLLKKKSFLPDAFYSGSEKFVFKIALPCMLFLNVAESTVENPENNIPLVLFFSTMAVAIVLLRGEEPFLDAKYDLMHHPNIRYTPHGGAKPYTHIPVCLYDVGDLDFTFTSLDDIEITE